MSTTRRQILGQGASAVAFVAIPNVVGAHLYSEDHPHPHVPSHTPIHMLFATGVEHSFLDDRTINFSRMERCLVVIEHGLTVEHQVFQQVMAIYEHVPLFVHYDNPIRNLSRSQVGDILLGRTRNWREIGGPDREIEVVTRGFSHWKSAFGAMVSINFLEPSFQTIKGVLRALRADLPIVLGEPPINVTWQHDYKGVSDIVGANEGAIAVSLRPVFAQDLVPIHVDNFAVSDANYPIQVPSFINARRNKLEARQLAEQVIAKVARRYLFDFEAITKVAGGLV